MRTTIHMINGKFHLNQMCVVEDEPHERLTMCVKYLSARLIRDRSQAEAENALGGLMA